MYHRIVNYKYSKLSKLALFLAIFYPLFTGYYSLGLSLCGYVVSDRVIKYIVKNTLIMLDSSKVCTTITMVIDWRLHFF